jgi:hypothetical protein
MGLRFSRLATVVLVVAAVVLMTSRSCAHWYDLGPSKDEWGVKYRGEVKASNGDKLNVRFTLANQGRLKPIHSVFVMALSNPDRSGSRTYLLKAPITLKRSKDGELTGHVAVRKEFANRAVIRVFTYTIDGRSQMVGPTAGARYYDIPLRKLLKKAPLAASPQSPLSIASPPASKFAK